ncbi:MAG: hypothetical protein JXR34_04770, partial [Bacteroidales bacterium]|nr:hypothetical protein [Bacteroidales bacterium]
MHRLNFIALLMFLAILSYGQVNLATTGIPSASASSSGSYGPANWNDGLIGNNYYFGWLGTDPNSFVTPAWLAYTWSASQTINRIRFYKPDHYQGNFVYFQGSALLQYLSSGQWITLDTFEVINPNTSGIFTDFSFQTITTTSLRLYQFSITGQHNPGWDEIEVYYDQPAPPPLHHDVGIETIIFYDTTKIGEYPLKVKIVNYANTLADSINVCYRNNGSTPVCKALIKANFGFNQTTPFDTILMTLDSTYISFGGNHIIAWTELQLDSFPANDTVYWQTIGIPDGIEEIEVLDFVISPNPTSNHLNIEGNLNNAEIVILDMSGKALMVLRPESNQN